MKLDRVLTTALLLALASASLSAQSFSGWRWIDPSPTGLDLYDVVVAPDGEITIAGDHASVLSLADGSWRTRHEGSLSRLSAIAFASDEVAVAVGDHSTIARSTDGGRTWHETKTAHNAMFLDVAFSDATTGVIVGGGGLAGAGVLRTVDAGATWSLVTPSVTPTLHAVTFRGTLGLAVGAAGTVLRTTDAGASWSIALRDTLTHAGDFASVAFVSDDVAVAVGELGRIVRSSDGGATWTEIRREPYAPTLFDVAFSDPLHGVAVGDGWASFSTTDGGLTWSVAAVPGKVRHAIAFASDGRGWVVGEGGFVTATTDGGVTWEVLSRAIGGLDYYAITSDAEGRLAAVADDGSIVASEPDATGFRSITPAIRKQLNAVAWTRSGALVAVGNEGLILRAEAGSSAAAQVVSGVATNLNDVHATPAGALWAVGLGGVILRSSDDGLTWSRIASPTTDVIDGIDVRSETTVWIVGRKGMIFRSTDGGATWQDRRSPTTNYLNAVRIRGDDEAIVVGASGVAIRTTDAGTSWTFAKVEGNPSLADVDFIDERNGIAVGPDGVAARTTDGGISWTRRDLPIRERGSSFVHMTATTVSGASVIAAGTAGIILAYDFDETSGPGAAPQERASAAVALIGAVDRQLRIPMPAGAHGGVLLYDALGRAERRNETNVDGDELLIDCRGIAAGRYWVVLETRAGRRLVAVAIVE